MKLDIYIKQMKSETSIIVEIDGIRQLSMRKILGTFPDDVVKAVEWILNQRESVIITDITLKPQIHRIKRKH